MLFPIQLAENKEVPKKIQLMRTGEFVVGGAGEKIKITPEILFSFKKNFDANVRGYPDKKLPIDYFHQNDQEAAGWITSVELSDQNNTLTAEVEWTPRASKMLSEGEIRYVSAEFNLQYQHNEGGQKFGPALLGAGLTNRPVIKGMKPVAAAETGSQSSSSKYGGSMTDAGAAPCGASAVVAPAAGTAMTLEQAMAKIKELTDQLSALHSDKTKMSDTMADMQKKLDIGKADSEKDKVASEKKNSFNTMLANGKVVEAQREAFMSSDMIKFSELSKATNSGKGGSDDGNNLDGDKDLDVQDKVLKLAEAIVVKDKIKMSEAISIVLKQNKKLSDGYNKFFSNQPAVHFGDAE